MTDRLVNSTVLCRIEDLHDPGSRGITVQLPDRQLDLFVVRRNGNVYAYVNRCPHTGSPLDWVPHDFLTPDGNYIQCATHAALFQVEDGLCVAGPCTGDGLVAIPVKVETGLVVMTEPAPSSLPV